MIGLNRPNIKNFTHKFTHCSLVNTGIYFLTKKLRFSHKMYDITLDTKSKGKNATKNRTQNPVK